MNRVPGISRLYSRVLILVMVALLLVSGSPFPFAANQAAAEEPGAGLVTQECSNKQAEWIWCDDFE
ncbi:hypothetical protein, partial [Paenibacillus koleovorans]|uniref:hypothetical protein n=1 Tax=Paenibacillus koleovorans TaxID=121608 RepID=UPI001C3FAF90